MRKYDMDSGNKPASAARTTSPAARTAISMAEQEDEGKPAHVCVRDAKRTVLARLESRYQLSKIRQVVVPCA
jgi:hypothetical protein